MAGYGSGSIKVWDPFVRVFHWSLVVFFAVAFLSGEEAEGLHVFAGYVVSVLVALRIIWGFVGTTHARFTDFVRGPSEVSAYLKGFFSGRGKRYLGHNPAGGLMVVLLLISISITCWTGLATYGAEGHGPLAGDGAPSLVSVAYADDDDDDRRRGRRGGGEELWEEVHEVFSGITLFLVAVHIGGVVVTSLVERENLILAMITGKKSRR